MNSRFPIPSYSHSGEDRCLWKLFGYRQGGFYVDVGCYHPVDYSNTFLLYQNGWRGICIDANPDLLEAFEHHRPADQFINCGIGSEKGTLPFYVYPDKTLNTFDARMVAEYERKGIFGKPTTRNVRVAPLRDFLPGCPAIDLLTVDVEGWDLEVLQTHDWMARPPKIVAVEDHSGDIDDIIAKSATYSFLRSKGYSFHSKVNYTSIYTREKVGRP